MLVIKTGSAASYGVIAATASALLFRTSRHGEPRHLLHLQRPRRPPAGHGSCLLKCLAICRAERSVFLLLIKSRVQAPHGIATRDTTRLDTSLREWSNLRSMGSPVSSRKPAIAVLRTAKRGPYNVTQSEYGPACQGSCLYGSPIKGTPQRCLNRQRSLMRAEIAANAQMQPRGARKEIHRTVSGPSCGLRLIRATRDNAPRVRSGSRAVVAALAAQCRVLPCERTCRRLRRMLQMGQ